MTETVPKQWEESKPVSLWTENVGPAVITCTDRNDYFTASLGLPAEDSDPLVKELQTVLEQVGETGWNVLVVSLEEHAEWPEIDEGDYFSGVVLQTANGELELDYVKNSPGDVLRETGLLSPVANDLDDDLKSTARDLRIRLHDRQSQEPAIYYLMTKEHLTDVRSAVGQFPTDGRACTR